jgi:hypothetical protein
MEIFLLWFGLSIAIGAVAAGKDRSGFGWFVLSLVISPLLAGLFLLLVGDGRSSRCPYCAERVKAAARICPHCKSELVQGEIVIEGQKPSSRWRSR